MFSKMKAVAAAAAVAGVVVLGGASSASAFNIGTVGTPVGSGTMAMTASAGASRLVVNGALPLNCTTSTAATTSTPIATGGGFTFPRTIFSVQVSFSGCTGPSGFVFDVLCTTTSSLTVTGLTSGTVAGFASSFSCLITFTALGCTATASGSVQISYTNPTTTVAGRLAVLLAGQSLSVTGSTCPANVLPNGTAQFGAPVGTGTGLGNLGYTVTSGPPTTHPFFS